MKYVRMPIEIESPEQMGYGNIKFNLTESSFRDCKFSELDLNLHDLVLGYGDHRGHAPLRELLAQDFGVGADDVLLTVGAASALFIIATSLLQAGDRLLVVRPNYATNIETPRAIGAQIDFFDLTFEQGFRIDIDALAAQIQPDTRLVSITTPHNPTGVMLTETELRRLVEITAEKGCVLLVDETYRDMAYAALPPLAAALGSHVISVASLSKTYGLPGIRLGWLVCQNATLMQAFLAAKEQIFICGSMLDEEVAWQYLKKRDRFLPAIRTKIAENREVVSRWLASEIRVECIPPQGGVVCFPRIKKSARIDIENFYRVLNETYQTFVGPGHWFEQDRAFMRIGFGWPSTAELVHGLENISRSLDETKV